MFWFPSYDLLTTKIYYAQATTNPPGELCGGHLYWYFTSVIAVFIASIEDDATG